MIPLAPQPPPAQPSPGERPDRSDELARNLEAVRRRIDSACLAADRVPADVTLVAVTKTWPAADVRILHERGITDVGENREQEAAPKARLCADLSLIWHFVGQLQTNKCRSVASFADVVHSVDRERLAAALGREASRAGRSVTCLIQVDVGDPDGESVSASSEASERAGVPPRDVVHLGDVVARTEGLALGGVMAMAPLHGEPGVAFAQLAGAAAELRDRYPAASIISAGMSGDLEAAIAHGATHVRIGTALLGTRQAYVG